MGDGFRGSANQATAGSCLLAIDRWNFFRGKAGGKNDLQHFNVVAVAKFPMPDAWRLGDARACFEANCPLTFVFELDPALQHVHELKVRSVQMRLA